VWAAAVPQPDAQQKEKPGTTSAGPKGIISMNTLNITDHTCCDNDTDVIRCERTLAELEDVIRPGLNAYVEVGKALSEINERRLYRDQGYHTFEEYCEKTWGIKRQTAYDYIKAADVAENVRTSVQTQPSLSQSVELSVLAPEQQREIAARTNFGIATVRDVREQVRVTRQGSVPAKQPVQPLYVHVERFISKSPRSSDEPASPPCLMRRIVQVVEAALKTYPAEREMFLSDLIRHLQKMQSGGEKGGTAA
jgi:hypothetical protein